MLSRNILSKIESVMKAIRTNNRSRTKNSLTVTKIYFNELYDRYNRFVLVELSNCRIKFLANSNFHVCKKCVKMFFP